MKYTFFWESDSCFSNWHAARFTHKGKTFSNSEQAFMWEKAILFGDNKTADLVLRTSNPREVKKLGRQVHPFDSVKWDKMKFDLMYEVNLSKFSQNEEMKKKLLAGENFVEASPYDAIWGIGMKETDAGVNDPRNWKGQNLLGKVLDKVNETLKSK